MKIIKVTAMWCMSCLVMQRVYEKAFKDYSFDVIDYDFDEDKDKLGDLNIGKTLPVIILFKGDVEVGRVIGEKSLKELKKHLEEYSK